MTLLTIILLSIAAIWGIAFAGKGFLTMTIVSNPLIGQARKKTGGVYFRKWKNLIILANKALTVSNPNTPLQQKARSAFSQLTALYRSASNVAAFGFQSLLGSMGANAAFQKTNNNTTVVGGVAPVATIDLTEVKMAKGSIAPTNPGTIVAENSTTAVVVPFSDTVDGPGQALTDLARVAVYNETANKWGFATGTANRGDGTVTVTMPEDMDTNDELHVWLFFRAVDGQTNSDSVYAAKTVTA